MIKRIWIRLKTLYQDRAYKDNIALGRLKKLINKQISDSHADRVPGAAAHITRDIDELYNQPSLKARW